MSRLCTAIPPGLERLGLSIRHPAKRAIIFKKLGAFHKAMLDTHAAVKELTKAGLSEDAAEAIVQVQLRTLHQGLATKEDLYRATSAIKEELSDYRIEAEKRFGSIEAHFGEVEKRFGSIEAHFGDIEKHFGEVEKRFSALEGSIAGLEVATEKRFSALEGNLGEFKVEVERRFGRLTMLTWVVLVIVLLSNPIAARLLERLLGVSF